VAEKSRQATSRKAAQKQQVRSQRAAQKAARKTQRAARSSAAAATPKQSLAERLAATRASGRVERAARAANAQAGRTGGAKFGSTAVNVLIVMVVVIAISLAALFALSNMPVFTITTVEGVASEHLSETDIVTLADVDAGSTLLNLDTDEIEENLKKNPWVAAVRVSRKFPDTISIEVVERSVKAVVLMGSSDMAWYLGEGNIWIEPAEIDTSSATSTTDVALALAQEHDCLLITDVPSTVSPKAGEEATEDEITVVQNYVDGFSSSFLEQIVSFSVPSADSCSCILQSGVEVSLGDSSDIATKEVVIAQILETYQDQVTFINVRIPSKPSIRKIDSEDVQEGTGVTVDDGAGDEDSSGEETSEGEESDAEEDSDSESDEEE